MASGDGLAHDAKHALAMLLFHFVRLGAIGSEEFVGAPGREHIRAAARALKALERATERIRAARERQVELLGGYEKYGGDGAAAADEDRKIGVSASRLSTAWSLFGGGGNKAKAKENTKPFDRLEFVAHAVAAVCDAQEALDRLSPASSIAVDGKRRVKAYKAAHGSAAKLEALIASVQALRKKYVGPARSHQASAANTFADFLDRYYRGDGPEHAKLQEAAAAFAETGLDRVPPEYDRRIAPFSDGLRGLDVEHR